MIKVENLCEKQCVVNKNSNTKFSKNFILSFSSSETKLKLQCYESKRRSGCEQCISHQSQSMTDAGYKFIIHCIHKQIIKLLSH